MLFVTLSPSHTPPSPFQEAFEALSVFVVPVEGSQKAVACRQWGHLKGPAEECWGQRRVNRWSLSIIWDPLYIHTLHLQLFFSMLLSLMHTYTHTHRHTHSTSVPFISFLQDWVCSPKPPLCRWPNRPPNSISLLLTAPFFHSNILRRFLPTGTVCVTSIVHVLMCEWVSFWKTTSRIYIMATPSFPTIAFHSHFPIHFLFLYCFTICYASCQFIQTVLNFFLSVFTFHRVKGVEIQEQEREKLTSVRLGSTLQPICWNCSTYVT